MMAGYSAAEIEGKLKGLYEILGKAKSHNKQLKKEVEKKQRTIRALREDLHVTKEALAHEEAEKEYEKWQANLRLTGKTAGQAGGIAREYEEKRRRRDEDRRKLISGMAIGDDDEELVGKSDVRGGVTRIWRRLRWWFIRHMPLNHDVNAVEWRFGHSVQSYFVFFQLLFINALFVGLIMLIHVLVHVITLAIAGTQQVVLDGMNITTAPVNWGAFEGLAPSWLLFSSYGAAENLNYSTCLFLSFFLLIVYTSIRWTQEDKKVQLESSGDGNMKHAKTALNCWDHRFSDVDDAQELQVSIGNEITLLLDEDDIAARISSRSFRDKVKLLVRRILCMLIWLALQGGSLVGIIYLTLASSDIEKAVRESGIGLTVDLVPIFVSVINAILPQIIIQVVKQMRFDREGKYIQYQVALIFITKTLNAIFQVLSYLLLADPFLMTQPGSDSVLGIPGRSTFASRDFVDSYLEVVYVNGIGTTTLREAENPSYSNCRGNQVGSQVCCYICPPQGFGLNVQYDALKGYGRRNWFCGCYSTFLLTCASIHASPPLCSSHFPLNRR